MQTLSTGKLFIISFALFYLLSAIIVNAQISEIIGNFEGILADYDTELIDNKYQQVLLTEDPVKGKYEIHEYITPSGEAGYQILTYSNLGIESLGFGVEANDRTFTIIYEQPIVSTTKE